MPPDIGKTPDIPKKEVWMLRIDFDKTESVATD